jgi:c-di-GMP-binding flagellar brake protein YcgR
MRPFGEQLGTNMLLMAAGDESGGGHSSERRRHRRIEMELPIEIFVEGSEVPLVGSTRNVSAGGVKFVVPRRLEQNSDLEFVLSLPREITLCDTMRMRCKGKILRVSTEGELGSTAVASIQKYEFLPGSPTTFPW